MNILPDVPCTSVPDADFNETKLLHQLESVMRSLYVREEMAPASRQRVLQLLLYRYTEA